MRQSSRASARPARTLAPLLAVILSAGLIIGTAAIADAALGSGPGAATPTTLESAGGGGSSDPFPDKRQSGIPTSGAMPTAAAQNATSSLPASSSPAPSSPLPTSSPLSHTTPMPASPTPGASSSQPQARASATHTVAFDPAGGSGVGAQAVPEGGQASRPYPDPSREGYLFDGWFQGDVAYDFSRPVTGGITLTARWTKGDGHWAISPTQGPAAGGAKVTLTPPMPRGIRFSQVGPGSEHVAAIGSDGNLYTWGRNIEGQLGDSASPGRPRPAPLGKPQDAPEGFTWQQASPGGGYHSAAIGSDGSLYTWGSDSNGQLGRDTGATPAGRPGKVGKPQDAPEGFTWTQASLGDAHSAAIGSDGNLYTWGWNRDGQLGDGTRTDRDRPVQVGKPQGAPQGFTWRQASLGALFSAAIGSDGNLYTWGSDSDGQLGRDTDTVPADRPGKVDRPAGVAAWTKVSLGGFHSAAIGSDGSLYTWGYNHYGQLGDGTKTSQDRPVQVGKPQGAPQGFTWGQASLGYGHSAASGSDGNLYAWGTGYEGQLGDGADGAGSRRDAPAPVGRPQGAPQGFTWTQASLSDNGEYSTAIGSDGSLYTFGANTGWQLGRDKDMLRDSRPGPATLAQQARSVPKRLCFDQAACSALGQGLQANPDGTWQAATPKHEPGDADVAISWDRDGPQPDAHLKYTFIARKYQVGFASSNDACPAPSGMPPAQTVMEGRRAERPYPDPKAEGCLFDGWFQGDAAYDFTQPVAQDITLTAHWTKGDSRWTISPTQGPETGGTEVTLTPPAQRGIRFSQLSMGYNHSAAIGSDGNLYTWGGNDNGQLGDGTNTNQNTPTLVGKPQGAPDGFTWKQVILGGWHSGAIGSDGNLYTWGDNGSGQLGDGTTTNQNRPVLVGKPEGAPKGFAWKQVSLGGFHSAAIGSDGSLYTWGYNEYGQLGDGTTTNQNRPVLVDKPQNAPKGFTWKQASLGGWHSAAIGSDDNLYTWGRNSEGQLGDGTTTNRSTPVLVGKPQDAPEGFAWTHASLGERHSAAAGSDGGLYTWGRNSEGQLGDGTTTNRSMPIQIAKPEGAPDGFTWAQANLGDGHSAAFGSDGNLYAWGYNGYGQLGDGTATDRHWPTLVGKPQGAAEGFTWRQASLGWYHSAAIGSDGQLYTWGRNDYGQLGRSPSNAWPASRPGPVGFPGRPQATGVCFGQNQQQGTCLAAGTSLKPSPDGTWKVTTPPYTPGLAPVAIDWTQDGMPQETDKGNAYRYLSIASLPLTGGGGMLLLLATGLLAAGAATAAKSRGQQTHTTDSMNTSHE